MTRGRICHLQLQLVLASAVILGSEFNETHDPILLSQIRDSPNLEGQVPVFISSGNRAAVFIYIIYKNSVRISQETHYVTATKPNRLMLFRETVAVYCENRTEHTNTLCGQNAEFGYVKAGATYCHVL
jgi:hypothetical protein